MAVRTGDTPPAERAAMLKRPPNFLITTPESLYLLVTAERTRAMLAPARTVIVDEIHAVAGNKRGSHLALTLERLEHLAAQPVQRIGLSATQRPIETVARLLVGAGPGRSAADGSPRCAIVDSGHRRELDLALELPGDELGAVASAEQMDEILDLIAGHVQEHRTTLVFVNTRRMAERVAHQLGETLGEGQVAAHHGSLSKDRRQRVESRLRSGDLRALVATASLELGIDIGPVELVCQIGSPRSFATFLQRVGRSNHTRGGIPAGRLYPTSRDELVECAALLRGARAGRLDALQVPACPLDILAQQVVAECAAEDWAEDDLLALVRRAAPFADLSAEDFDDVADLVSDGIRTGRGRRAAYLHRDRVAGRLAGRRGARLAALTSGGAIPELGDFRVLAEPDDTLVGTVNEDWAIESMAGDVFLLGTTSWRIRRVEPGVVRVVDAQGAPPSVPFWLGEAPGRTIELSEEVCAIRKAVAERLATGQPAGTGAADAAAWLRAECGIGEDAADTIAAYLAAGLAQLGVLPDMDTIVLERFFDESGGMQLVGHAPFGARLNRALGLALRKRFCVTFDFELQAAASDDAILLSLGPQHSFPLDQVPRFLASKTVEGVVRQAVLTSPMFAARWRWNLNRSLAVLRMRGGKKNPPAIQRMESDDLMAAVFPTLAACQENVAPGPLEIPDHVLVRQTLEDCLHEAMDIDGLTQLVGAIESGRVTVVVRDTTEPSVLAHEILNGRPFTFLDDAPLEERRSRAVPLRRGLPVEPHELGRLDPAAIDRVAEQVRPDPRGPDELHDLLMTLTAVRPAEEWRPWFGELTRDRRAVSLHGPAGELWCAVERRPAAEVLFPDAAVVPDHPCPAAAAPANLPDPDEAAADLLRGHLDCRGPSTVTDLAQATGLPETGIAIALARLEAEGFAIRGRFRPGSRARSSAPGGCWPAFTPTPGSGSAARSSRSPRGTSSGSCCAGSTSPPAPRPRGGSAWSASSSSCRATSWPRARGRTRSWRPGWTATGVSGWTRPACRARSPGGGCRCATASPTRPRGAAGWSRPGPPRSPWPSARICPGCCARPAATSRPPNPDQAGPATCSTPSASTGRCSAPTSARSPAACPARWRRRCGTAWPAGWSPPTASGRSGPCSGAARGPGRPGCADCGGAGAARGPGRPGDGRCFPGPSLDADRDELAEAVAEQLAVRWGVVFHDLVARENLALPWREVLWAFRRMEARGTIRGGRFVAGFSGEQFAHPDALDVLRAVRKQRPTGEPVQISAADPLNLTSIVLPGPRIPAIPANTVTYVDGAVASATTADPARAAS